MEDKYVKIKTINRNETNDDKDIFEVLKTLSDATAEEISDIFSLGINPEAKKRFDYADLVTISEDINRYEEFLYRDPDTYKSEKQRIIESNNLNIKEDDKFRWNASEPRIFPATMIQASIDDFIFKIENIIKKTTCINDMKKIEGIYDSITLIKPKLRNRNGQYMNNRDNIDNYGFTNVITDIRNGLMHNSYIVYGSNVYIKNPEGGNDENGFEAVVSFDFFNYMYHFGRNVSRKPQLTSWPEYNIKWKKGYQANIDKIGTIITDTKKSDQIMGLEDQADYLIENGINKVQPLSKGKNELLKGFFDEHAFTKENLKYAFIGMNDKSLGIDFWQRMGKPGRKEDYLLGIRNNYIKLNSSPRCLTQQDLWNELAKGDNIDNRLIWKDKKYLKEFIKNKYNGSNVYTKVLGKITKEKDLMRLERYVFYMKSILESYRFIVFESNFRLDYLKILYISKFFINNPTLELAEPQKREGTALKNQGINFIRKKCKNQPDAYRSKESKQNNLNKMLGNDYWLYIFKQFTSGKLSTDQIIQKAYEDKRIAGDKREILKNNIKYVIEKREDQLNEVTIIQEPEHIRNAFAHHNYTIIPGYNKILLEDPSRNDFPDWRKVYDLDELYNYCLGKTKECLLGRTSEKINMESQLNNNISAENYLSSIDYVIGKCRNFEDETRDLYEADNSTANDITKAVNNTIDMCKNAIKRINRLGAWEGDSLLKDSAIRSINLDIALFQELLKSIPYLEIDEANKKQEEEYDKIIARVDKIDAAIQEDDEKLSAIQAEFAKKYGIKI